MQRDKVIDALPHDGRAFVRLFLTLTNAALCKLHGVDWTKDHRVAEGCLSDKALRRYLERHPEITVIVFCYDNDIDGTLPDGTPHNHGQMKAKHASREFTELGYKTFIQTPGEKDFNLDLRVFKGMLVPTIRQAADLDEDMYDGLEP